MYFCVSKCCSANARPLKIVIHKHDLALVSVLGETTQTYPAFLSLPCIALSCTLPARAPLPPHPPLLSCVYLGLCVKSSGPRTAADSCKLTPFLHVLPVPLWNSFLGKRKSEIEYRGVQRWGGEGMWGFRE